MIANFNSIICNFSSKNFKNRYHLLFISLLLVNYFFPLLIFGEITLFYHDNLDIVLVYNHILGKIYKGDISSIDIFLAGKIKIEFLQHLLKPYSLLYGLFSTELAYWITHFLFKLTCYFSFFLLAKKINRKNIFLCCLIACLFACINIRVTDGFGVAAFPYLIYLILYKKKLNIKHYLIITLIGLNTDIIGGIFSIPFIVLLIFIINSKIIKGKFKNILQILAILFFTMMISSSNLIYAQLFSEAFHREEFFREPLLFIDSISNFFISLFKFPTQLNWTLFYHLPYTTFLLPLIILSFFSKNKIVQKFLFLIIIIHLFLVVSNSEIILNLRNSAGGIIKTYNFTFIEKYLPVLHVFLFLYLTIEKERFYKLLFYPSLFAILLFQINSSAVPIFKKYFLNEGENYKNIYTFKGYYSYDSYKEIKKIVKNKRILSIGLDPMVAIMNNIKTIDGYHTLYPLSYKKEFRKIIQKELEDSEKFQKYYDHWGSRVYAFVNDPNNIKINYKEAKKIGADYILSKFSLDSEELILACEKCKGNLHLYKIQ